MAAQTRRKLVTQAGSQIPQEGWERGKPTKEKCIGLLKLEILNLQSTTRETYCGTLKAVELGQTKEYLWIT